MNTRDLYRAPMTYIGPDAEHIVYKIDSTTTPEQFDCLCEQYPNYNIESTCDKKFKRLIDQKGMTAFHQAIEYHNLELVTHLVNKFGKKIINVQNLAGISPLHQALIASFAREDSHNHNPKIVELLITSGANVNDCYVYYENKCHNLYPVSVLQRTVHFRGGCNKDKITKLVLQYGAQDGIYFTQNGCDVLYEATLMEKDCTMLLKQNKPLVCEKTYDKEETAILDEAKSEIYAEKFQFFAGLKHEGSPINLLPQEIVRSILTYHQLPSIKERAYNMLDKAFKKISENEVLFLCANDEDSSSTLSIFPKEIALFILEKRITLDL